MASRKKKPDPRRTEAPAPGVDPASEIEKAREEISLPPSRYLVRWKNPETKKWEIYKNNLSLPEATMLAAQVKYVISQKRFGVNAETKVEPEQSS